ncbi:hypothetical protein L484_007628 [Morus notabilis]|uniref:Uncharacterized protein n=1 Tax=Morus notabilis TaxID=981085 RepID=W9QB70_9ROSA|nr:hypothetical protein L484_007628 [Morus notabilis]
MEDFYSPIQSGACRDATLGWPDTVRHILLRPARAVGRADSAHNFNGSRPTHIKTLLSPAHITDQFYVGQTGPCHGLRWVVTWP